MFDILHSVKMNSLLAALLCVFILGVKTNKITKVTVQNCVKATAIEAKLYYGGNLFMYSFLPAVSKQWKADSNNSLEWSQYEKQGTWKESCRFNDSFRRCLQPLKQLETEFTDDNPNSMDVITAEYLNKLCKNEDILSKQSGCIHRLMLSDGVLRCQGVYNWWMGKRKGNSKRNSVMKCVMEKSKNKCGKEGNEVLESLINDYTEMSKVWPSLDSSFIKLTPLCDVCYGYNIKKGKQFEKFDNRRKKILSRLLNDVSFPDRFHIKYPFDWQIMKLNIWVQKKYEMFCHYLKLWFVPTTRPELPLCDLDKWIESSQRICEMDFMTLQRSFIKITVCTRRQDELYPCYKGSAMSLFTWSLVSAGNVWPHIAGGPNEGPSLGTVYSRIIKCTNDRYSKIKKRCRYGHEVVDLMRDVRVVLRIDPPAMFGWAGKPYGKLQRHLDKTAYKLGPCQL